MDQNTVTDNNASADPIFEEEPIEIPMDNSAWFTPLALLGCLAAAVITAFCLS